MSLIPMIFSNWWEDLDHPHSIMDQHFGQGLRPEQLRSSYYVVPRPRPEVHPESYYRPWAEVLRRGTGGSSVVNADKDQFKVVLDVQQFTPEEINVKVIDNCVVVEGKHEEKRDEHGFISRQFQRRYIIPDQCDIEQVGSSLSSDGILSITVPRKEQPKPSGERAIKIQHTGQPAVKEAPEENSCKAKNDQDKKKPAAKK